MGVFPNILFSRLTFMNFYKKITNKCRRNQKIFFPVQSTRLADPFELLNSSLAQSAEELGRW